MDGYVKNRNDNELRSLKWEHAKNIVCSLILGLLSKSNYSGHAYTESVEEIWNELLETYTKLMNLLPTIFISILTLLIKMDLI